MSDNAQRLAVPVGETDHARGPNDALVTLVEYGDYECPLFSAIESAEGAR